MGTGYSQEQQSEFSHTIRTSETHDNHQNMKTTVMTTNAQLNNLPHDHKAILKDDDTIIDKKRKKPLIDEASHGDCSTLFARDLSITWSEDNRYWQWSYIKDTSEDVAEMLNVCWLEVQGKFDMAKLTPGIKYEVVFVVMLKDPAYGWEVPINVRLILPHVNKQERKENMMEKPRNRWFEIQVGEFMAEVKGFVEFALYEYEGGLWKRGLLVKGAVIKPKDSKH